MANAEKSANILDGRALRDMPYAYAVAVGVAADVGARVVVGVPTGAGVRVAGAPVAVTATVGAAVGAGVDVTARVGVGGAVGLGVRGGHVSGSLSNDAAVATCVGKSMPTPLSTTTVFAHTGL
jgi:hypothetical protein